MKFGLRYASLGRYGNGPAAVELAQAAEAAGFESIWTVEHVVVPHGARTSGNAVVQHVLVGYEDRDSSAKGRPASRRTRPRSLFADVSTSASRTVPSTPIPDPLIWLAYVASATRTIKLGTAILILPQRNPVVTAKAVATLDHLATLRVRAVIRPAFSRSSISPL